jgi:hypothetical protein
MFPDFNRRTADSDLIKAFVENGGAVIAFGPQIPMGRTYERKDLFGIDETGRTAVHKSILVRTALGNRSKEGSSIYAKGIQLPVWRAENSRVIAAFEDGSPAATMNKVGKGLAISILPDAQTAVQILPELVRDILDYAVAFSGKRFPVDITGGNDDTDIAISETPDGFRVAFVNHNPGTMEIILRPVNAAVKPRWTDMVSGQRLSQGRGLKLKIPAGGFLALEYQCDSNAR